MAQIVVIGAESMGEPPFGEAAGKKVLLATNARAHATREPLWTVAQAAQRSHARQTAAARRWRSGKRGLRHGVRGLSEGR